MAAFEVWNENSAYKKAVYLKMKTDKYGSVIVALMKLSPGEKFCIRFNTEGRNVKSNEPLTNSFFKLGMYLYITLILFRSR